MRNFASILSRSRGVRYQSQIRRYPLDQGPRDAAAQTLELGCVAHRLAMKLTCLLALDDERCWNSEDDVPQSSVVHLVKTHGDHMQFRLPTPTR